MKFLTRANIVLVQEEFLKPCNAKIVLFSILWCCNLQGTPPRFSTKIEIFVNVIPFYFGILNRCVMTYVDYLAKDGRQFMFEFES